MMRPSLVVISLLLFSLLLSQAQGIRLEKGSSISIPVEHPKAHEEGALTRSSNTGGVGDVILCNEGHCTGKSRKLITATTSSSSTPTTASKSEKNGEYEANPTSKPKSSSNQLQHGGNGKHEKFPTNSPTTTSEHEEVAHDEQYADIMDIEEMDYSPAKRKPPIHN